MKKLLVSLSIGLVTFVTNSQEANSVGRAYTEITEEVVINAPIEKVWKEFSTIENIYLNSPTVNSSTIISEIKTGVGAVRHMEMSIKEGAILDEKIIEWREGTYMKLQVIKIYKVSGIQTMGGDFELIADGEKTILRSTLNYSMTNKMMGLMNRMMGKNKFAKLWKSILTGYKKHIETGEEVTAKTELDLKNVKLISIVISK